MSVRALCQRARVSCGACCGLYNLVHHGREPVAELLDRRTAHFAGMPRTLTAFRAAAASLDRGKEEAIFPMVKVCPLLGWLDAGRSRPGCLAHPAATGGVDLRDCGAYDARLCESFLCPSHSWLSEEEAALAERSCAGDPWLYGLVVTDVPFLRACLEGVAELSGTRAGLAHLERPAFAQAFSRLLALKEELAPGSEGLFGAFRAGPDGEPLPRLIDYGTLGREGARGSPSDTLLLCMGADPRSGNDLDLLQGEVEARLAACADALASHLSDAKRRPRGELPTQAVPCFIETPMADDVRSRAELLDATRWANEFAWAEIEALAVRLSVKHVENGVLVCEEGEADPSLFIIARGSAAVQKATPGAAPRLLARLGRGQTIGEMALLDGQPRSATVVAAEDLVLLVLARAELERLVEESPRLAAKLLWKLGRLISQRLRQTSGALADKV